MKLRSYLILLLGITCLELLSQNVPDHEILRNTQRNVCALKIVNASTRETVAMGCGVVLRTKVNERNEYFIATAYHIVKNLLATDELEATLSLFDKNGNIYNAFHLNGNHILWTVKSMDAALLVVPEDLQPTFTLPDNYEFPGLSHLKMIGEPDWGEDIYLFGYRWINEDKFIDIVKKGILSVGTTELPGYQGHLVFLIDNMANKGMSGGLAFDEDGVGIGIISSYVYETDNDLLNSDDLTVCLPLSFYFNVLSSVIENKSDLIESILNNK